jgi:signal transduction histidine kinase/DNA-binding response OmpR family regulator
MNAWKQKNQARPWSCKLKNNQLISLLLAAALILLITGGLWLGYRRQQKDKKALHRQNLLIQKQAEQLQNLDIAKTRFFANVSHELRTPLTLMTGPVDSLLKKGQFSAEEHQLLKIAEHNGQQLQTLINRILDLQKMEAGKMNLHTRPTPLAAFFSTHLGQFESLATSKEIDYTIDIDIAAEAVAELDQEKCRQILNNLLSNAFKFTPRGGSINAGVALREQQLQLSVSDTGPGIHPDDLPYVFDHYFQTNRPEKPIDGGTGLGLALCQEYMTLFGGNISVRNNPQKGASFQLAFPVILTKEAAAAKMDSVPPKESAANPTRPLPSESTPVTTANGEERPTLLIVEDNAQLRDYLSLILKNDYQLVLAADGQEALDYLLPDPTATSAAPCQLILSDLMMPRMDGYQLVERLKSTDAARHLPVVMLTARADVRDKLKALRLGVDDYLLKPFQEEELKVRIANLLQNQAVRLATTTEEETPSKAPALISTAEQEWLARFEAYVQENYGSDILSVPFLAQEFAMSESSLYRQLKRLAGLTPGQYLKEVRLDKARQMLENKTCNSVEQVARAVGYGDYRAFSRSFKQRYGRLPSNV